MQHINIKAKIKVSKRSMHDRSPELRAPALECKRPVDGAIKNKGEEDFVQDEVKKGKTP